MFLFLSLDAMKWMEWSIKTFKRVKKRQNEKQAWTQDRSMNDVVDD